MKTSLLTCVVFVCGALLQPVFGQGSLTPPGSPTPTMKSLSQIEPRTAISSLPSFITAPGSYYVTTNLTGSASVNGISIQSGNVTLDLGGFVLTGGSNSLTGVVVTGNYTNIVVRNGTLMNWQRGADSDGFGTPYNVLYENLMVYSNVQYGILADMGTIIRQCYVAYNGAAIGYNGINCRGGEVVDCVARGNSGFGIYGTNCTIRNCRSDANNYGIGCANGMIIGCGAENNTNYGIELDFGYSSVRQCQVVGNGGSGIIVFNTAFGCSITENLVATNTYGINVAAAGCLVSGNECAQNGSPGIIIQSNGNRVDGNHVATPSGVVGIFNSNGAISNNVVVRNTVIGNGGAGFSIAGSNDIGPIGSASSATSPWANFSH